MAAYSTEQWLKGMVDYNVPDDTVRSILFNNGVAFDTSVSEVAQKERDLCLADLYMWLASSSSSTTGEYISDGGWQHQKAAKNVVDRAGLRAMAQRLYEKWGSAKTDTAATGRFTMKNLY